MDPAPPDASGLPRGPYPTIGPDTPLMPRWPGWLLTVVGGVVGFFALGALGLAAAGELQGVEPADVLWWLIGAGVLFVAGLAYLAARQIRIRSYLPPERYRGPTILLLIVLVLVVANLIVVPFGADAAAVFFGGEPTALGSFVVLVSTSVALALVSWLFVFRPRALVGWPSWTGPDPIGALRAGIGWGALAWLGSSLVAAAVVFVLERLGLPAEPQAAEQALAVVHPVIAVLAIVVAAPIAEEIFFRGVVFNAWLREGGVRVAFIGSALLFAVIHLSVVAVLPIFLLGLALAWVYRRTGNILAPIGMHATVNGLSVGIVLLDRYGLLPVEAFLR